MKKLILTLLLPSVLLAATPLKKEGKSFKGPSLQLNIAFFEKEPNALLAQFNGDVAKKAGLAGKIVKLSGKPDGNGINYFNEKKVKILSMVNGFVGPMYTSHLTKEDVILKEENPVKKVSTEAMWKLYLHRK